MQAEAGGQAMAEDPPAAHIPAEEDTAAEHQTQAESILLPIVLAGQHVWPQSFLTVNCQLLAI